MRPRRVRPLKPERRNEYFWRAAPSAGAWITHEDESRTSPLPAEDAHEKKIHGRRSARALRVRRRAHLRAGIDDEEVPPGAASTLSEDGEPRGKRGNTVAAKAEASSSAKGEGRASLRCLDRNDFSTRGDSWPTRSFHGACR